MARAWRCGGRGGIGRGGDGVGHGIFTVAERRRLLVLKSISSPITTAMSTTLAIQECTRAGNLKARQQHNGTEDHENTDTGKRILEPGGDGL